MTQTDSAVLSELRGNILVVTINRPDARNAVNQAVTDGIGLALDRAQQDPAIWVVVITGAGDKSFCAGADLKALATGGSIGPSNPEHLRWGFAGFVEHAINKPVIAAVNGPALGGGTELALAADLVVAADTATFGLPEVKRGIIAAAGGAFRLPRQIPKKIALEMMLTGEPIDAHRAATLGLVNKVVPQANVLESAIELAEKIVANAPLAVQATKRLASGIVDEKIAQETSDWAQNLKEIERVFQSADAMEGPMAFAQKRTPNWTAS